jgi:peroxiredoxin
MQVAAWALRKDRVMAYTILGVVLPWLLVGVGAWLVFELIKMSGRIVVRLEALEARLGPLTTHAGPFSQQASSSKGSPELAGLSPGSPAPEFDLPDLRGSRHTLAEYRGRRLLLIFFNPHCGFCTGMADALAKLSGVVENGVPMPLLVSTGSVDDNQDMMDEYEWKCPLLLQQQVEVAARYSAAGTPTGYLIDEQGKIASALTRGSDALLALARPASSVEAIIANRTTMNGQPKTLVATSFALNNVPVVAKSLPEPGNRCEKCKGRKQPCERCSRNGKVTAEVDQIYDLFELPVGVSVPQIVDELSAHAPHCRRMIVAPLTTDLSAFGVKELAGIRSFLLKNSEWVVSYREPREGRFFILSRDPHDRRAMPSKLTRAASFARAVAIHIGHGGRRVTAGQLEERLEICAMCEQRSGDRCGACGCSLWTKAGWRTSKCPLSKWPTFDRFEPAVVQQNQGSDQNIAGAVS